MSAGGASGAFEVKCMSLYADSDDDDVPATAPPPPLGDAADVIVIDALHPLLSQATCQGLLGRGVIDADGKGTEIVQRTDLDLARFHGFDDAGYEADADAVAQLGVFKSEVADLAQHGASVGVAVGVPAGGKRIHSSGNGAGRF